MQPSPIPFEDFEDHAAITPGSGIDGLRRQWRYYGQMLERGGRLDATIDFD
jgi:hypothetical protein